MRPFASIYKGVVEINCTCGHEFEFELPQVEEEYGDNWVVVDRVEPKRTVCTICEECETGYRITLSIESYCTVE